MVSFITRGKSIFSEEQKLYTLMNFINNAYITSDTGLQEGSDKEVS